MPSHRTIKAVPGGGGGKKKRFDAPFPGKPRNNPGKLEWGEFRIYTDVNQGKWRVLKVGQRADKAFSFADDAKAAWQNLGAYISA